MGKAKKNQKHTPLDFVLDVDGTLSSKRLIGFASFFILVISWGAYLFFGKPAIVEYMFESFMWLAAASLFSSAAEKFSLSRDRNSTFNNFGHADYYSLDQSSQPLPTNAKDNVIGDFDPNQESKSGM